MCPKILSWIKQIALGLSQTAQASAIIQAQRTFLGMKTPVGYQILLSISMQMFGLGLAGLAYRYIVEPPQMV